jgi:hypothetical protein
MPTNKYTNANVYSNEMHNDNGDIAGHFKQQSQPKQTTPTAIIIACGAYPLNFLS